MDDANKRDELYSCYSTCQQLRMQKTALMAVLHLENATIAERALTEFFQMCR